MKQDKTYQFEIESNIRKTITEFSSQEEYQKIIDYLEEQSKKASLSKYSRSSLKLAKQIIAMQETNEIPKKVNKDTNDNFYKEIDNNDYMGALDNVILSLKKRNEQPETNALYILLTKICQLEKDFVKDKMIEKRKEELEKYIAESHNKLIKDKGVILVDDMKKEDKDIMLDLTSNYSDILPFVIQGITKEMIVLKYHNQEDINQKEVLKEAKLASKQKRYHDSIKNNLILLQNADTLDENIIFSLGCLFSKIKKEDEYIKYLNIYYAIATNRKYKNNIGKILESIFNRKHYLEPKAKVSMNLTDFETNSSIDEEFEKLNEYIINSGLDVTTACTQLGIPQDAIDKLNLLYAQEYYKQKQFKQGDVFLQAVEKRRDKTKEVMTICNEVRNRKRFYQNRNTDTPKQLSLSLKPMNKK